MFVSDLSFKSFVGQMRTNERPRSQKEMNMSFQSGNEKGCRWPNQSAKPHLVSLRRFPWGPCEAVRNRFAFLLSAKQESKASMVTIHLGKCNPWEPAEISTLKCRCQEPAVFPALLVALSDLKRGKKVQDQTESTWVLTSIPATEEWGQSLCCALPTLGPSWAWGLGWMLTEMPGGYQNRNWC